MEDGFIQVIMQEFSNKKKIRTSYKYCRYGIMALINNIFFFLFPSPRPYQRMFDFSIENKYKKLYVVLKIPISIVKHSPGGR